MQEEKQNKNCEEEGIDEQEVPKMAFGDAVEILKKDRIVTRMGWNGKGMFLKLQVPDAFSKMSRPYIYMKTADNHFVPWVASQSDILSDDWLELV